MSGASEGSLTVLVPIAGSNLATWKHCYYLKMLKSAVANYDLKAKVMSGSSKYLRMLLSFIYVTLEVRNCSDF